jgi:hypothetical protein
MAETNQLAAAGWLLDKGNTVITFRRSKTNVIMYSWRDLEIELDKVPPGSDYDISRKQWVYRMFNDIEWLCFLTPFAIDNCTICSYCSMCCVTRNTSIINSISGSIVIYHTNKWNIQPIMNYFLKPISPKFTLMFKICKNMLEGRWITQSNQQEDRLHEHHVRRSLETMH